MWLDWGISLSFILALGVKWRWVAAKKLRLAALAWTGETPVPTRSVPTRSSSSQGSYEQM